MEAENGKGEGSSDAASEQMQGMQSTMKSSMSGMRRSMGSVGSNFKMPKI